MQDEDRRQVRSARQPVGRFKRIASVVERARSVQFGDVRRNSQEAWRTRPSCRRSGASVRPLAAFRWSIPAHGSSGEPCAAGAEPGRGRRQDRQGRRSWVGASPGRPSAGSWRSRRTSAPTMARPRSMPGSICGRVTSQSDKVRDRLAIGTRPQRGRFARSPMRRRSPARRPPTCHPRPATRIVKKFEHRVRWAAIRESMAARLHSTIEGAERDVDHGWCAPRTRIHR